MQLISHGGGDDGIIDFSWARGLPQKPRHKDQYAADDDFVMPFQHFHNQPRFMDVIQHARPSLSWPLPKSRAHGKTHDTTYSNSIGALVVVFDALALYRVMLITPRLLESFRGQFRKYGELNRHRHP